MLKETKNKLSIVNKLNINLIVLKKVLKKIKKIKNMISFSHYAQLAFIEKK